jgi:hypothetical protein
MRVGTIVEEAKLSMLHNGQSRSSRQLTWVKGRIFWGWGCSECDWIFNPSGVPAGKSLDEMKRNSHARISGEFADHAYSEHSRTKVEKHSEWIRTSVLGAGGEIGSGKCKNECSSYRKSESRNRNPRLAPWRMVGRPSLGITSGLPLIPSESALPQKQ